MKYRDHAEILPLPERAGQSWTHVTDGATLQLTGWPVWSALSCHGLEQLALPPIKRLLIYCDGDVPGWRAGDALAAHALRTGIKVAIKKPDHGDALDHYNARKQA